ncbi:MAG: BACON domain-containing protein [Bacteroidaceae bacterium]|nr:BACON domain-containing protein [Bacteroidaceae bacterium]
MNKLYLMCAALASLCFFSSCSNKSEYHGLNILYPSQYKILYADEESDSLVFETYDNSELYPLANWIEIIEGSSYDVTYNNRMYVLVSKLSFAPNTTGRTRRGAVQVNSYEYSSAAVYCQLGCLNISHPLPDINDPTQIPDTVSFDLTVDAAAVEDSICFSVSKAWTIDYAENADRSWATIDKTGGVAGDGSVLLTFEPNTDMQKRTTSFVLKSGGVTNTINVIQLPVGGDL